jgi:hypothetical protein
MLVRIKTTRYQEICLLIDILFIRKQCSKECNRSTINLIFSDYAKESVFSYSGLAMSGVFRPAGSLIRRMDDRHLPNLNLCMIKKSASAPASHRYNSQRLVFGGYSNRRLNDLWHFDCDTLTWTELNAASVRKEWPRNG